MRSTLLSVRPNTVFDILFVIAYFVFKRFITFFRLLIIIIVFFDQVLVFLFLALFLLTIPISDNLIVTLPILFFHIMNIFVIFIFFDYRRFYFRYDLLFMAPCFFFLLLPLLLLSENFC